jgi:hypothetical protein
VQARGQPERALGQLSQSQRFVARAAASAPGDIDEEWAQRVGHALQTGVQVGETLGGFGREELEGEVVCVLRQGRDLFVDSIHFRGNVVVVDLLWFAARRCEVGGGLTVVVVWAWQSREFLKVTCEWRKSDLCPTLGHNRQLAEWRGCESIREMLECTVSKSSDRGYQCGKYVPEYRDGRRQLLQCLAAV